MGLRDVLEKMKLVEMEPQPRARAPPPRSGQAATAPTSTGRAQAKPPEGAAARPRETIEQMLASLPPAPKVEKRLLTPAAGPGPGEDEPDFSAIYRAANVQEPPHGFTAYKVLEMLESDRLRSLDLTARAAAIQGFLEMNPGGPVPLRDVIQDAVRRDQALDAYEESLRQGWAARAQEVDKQNAELQAELDALLQRNREKIDANRKALEVEHEQFVRWQARKRIEERRLFEAVAPFVEENPITTASPPDGKRPGAGPS